jgi:translocation and assembly module TamA
VTRLHRTCAATIAISLGLAIAGSSEAAPNAAVEGVSDNVLRGELEAAIGEARTPPRSGLEARRRANQAAEDATALLRSEGYYNAVVDADVGEGTTPRALVKVTPGPRYRLTTSSIDWAPPRPDTAALAAAQRALNLSPGGPGRAADIVGAEGRVVAALGKLGYADAAIRPREVIVDHADQTVKPTFHIAAGDKVRLGALRLLTKEHGKTRVDRRWLASLAPWKPGTVYDPALLAKLQKRLLDTGAFEAATVALAPPGAGEGGVRPVEVTLADRRPFSLELGAGYSTTEGSGLDAKWTHYNRLGRGDSLILTAKLYDIQQKLDLEQDLPDWLAVDQTLKIGGGFLGDRTDAYDDVGGGVRADVIRKYTRTTALTLGAALDYASTREKTAVNLQAIPVGETLNLFIATIRAGFTLDRSNSILNPTKGWRVQAEADPTLIEGDRNLEYLKVAGQISGYWPLGRGLPDLAARVKVGSIVGGSLPNVPADRRFYAGGGGSVRGYPYQGVGPRLSDNTPVGGLSLTEASIEARQPLTRQLGLVVFADAGSLGSTSTPGYNNIAVGVGAGVRYDLGFGPLRLDVATPVNPQRGDSPIQVYISIGQAF